MTNAIGYKGYTIICVGNLNHINARMKWKDLFLFYIKLEFETKKVKVQYGIIKCQKWGFVYNIFKVQVTLYEWHLIKKSYVHKQNLIGYTSIEHDAPFIFQVFALLGIVWVLMQPVQGVGIDIGQRFHLCQ